MEQPLQAAAWVLLHCRRRSGEARGAAMATPTPAPCCPAQLYQPTLTTRRVNFYQRVANVSLHTTAEVTLCFPGQARSQGQPRCRASLALLLPSKHAEGSLPSADNKVMMFVSCWKSKTALAPSPPPGSAEPRPLLPVGASPQLQAWMGGHGSPCNTAPA